MKKRDEKREGEKEITRTRGEEKERMREERMKEAVKIKWEKKHHTKEICIYINCGHLGV
jgi:hypothetical protein